MHMKNAMLWGMLFPVESDYHYLLSSGKEIVIKEFTPGELFAELIVFTGEPYPGWLIASKDTRIIEVEYSLLLDYLEDREAMISFISGISKKLTHLTDTIEIMSLKTVKQKIAYTLLSAEHAEYGKHLHTTASPNKRREKFEFPVTVTGLAGKIGCSREAVSRAISEMESEGILVKNKKSIRIEDKKLLENIF
ncbi:MAG: Crp/Fnr family transcriptional regulator [Spirochaetales bacterium]|nr:Crp/Fnr family transcriptional regulator [Spirochaetales bacterium]